MYECTGSMSTSTAAAAPGGVYGTLVPRICGMNCAPGTTTCCPEAPAGSWRSTSAAAAAGCGCSCTPCGAAPPAAGTGSCSAWIAASCSISASTSTSDPPSDSAAAAELAAAELAAAELAAAAALAEAAALYASTIAALDGWGEGGPSPRANMRRPVSSCERASSSSLSLASAIATLSASAVASPGASPHRDSCSSRTAPSWRPFSRGVFSRLSRCPSHHRCRLPPQSSDVETDWRSGALSGTTMGVGGPSGRSTSISQPCPASGGVAEPTESLEVETETAACDACRHSIPVDVVAKGQWDAHGVASHSLRSAALAAR